MFSPLRALFVPLLAALLVGCQVAGSDVTPKPTATLRLFHSPTPTRTSTPVQAVSETGDGLRPTATPFVHVVEEGETLLDIALQYGVSLGEMQAANPEIDPRFLSIGQRLRIPGPDGQPADTLLPTSTPLPLDLGPGRCYSAPSGALWCMATVRNNSGGPVEGVTARLLLLGAEGEVLDRDVAFTPLNRVEAEGRMPLIAYFDPPAPTPADSRFEVLSAVNSTNTGDRYIQVQLSDLRTVPSAERSKWEVSATLALEEDGGIPAAVALGFDRQGSVVGYAKWTAAEGEAGPFDIELTVFSLGPPIEEMELVAEALRSPE